MKINYGFVALTKKNETQLGILHFCGYENKPTELDKKSLEEELNTDEEFGLVGRINKDVFILEAPEQIVKMYAREVRYATNKT